MDNAQGAESTERISLKKKQKERPFASFASREVITCKTYLITWNGVAT
jgi:hypothetical protein